MRGPFFCEGEGPFTPVRRRRRGTQEKASGDGAGDRDRARIRARARGGAPGQGDVNACGGSEEKLTRLRRVRRHKGWILARSAGGVAGVGRNGCWVGREAQGTWRRELPGGRVAREAAGRRLGLVGGGTRLPGTGPANI